MKKLIIIALCMVTGAAFLVSCGQTADNNSSGIRLIIRGDDIGSFHAANVGCMTSYTEGIMRTVEVMVPCPWYPEAVEMMNAEPGLDVGIHLVMTSEWENMKWRPLTGISSITDERGYFFPMVWSNENFPTERAFRESDWTIEDVERELRAQIELAKRDIPGVSHITSHMGFTSADPSIDSLVTALAKEFGLYIEPSEYSVQRFRYEAEKDFTLEQRIDAFITGLKKLEKGTYLFVEHPAMDTPEMETIGHTGYYHVGTNRQDVTDLFTSKKVMKAISDLGIELISYADL